MDGHDMLWLILGLIATLATILIVVVAARRAHCAMLAKQLVHEVEQVLQRA